MDEDKKTPEPQFHIEGATKRDGVLAVDLGNRGLFSFAVVLIFVELLGCFLHKQITQTGIPLIPTTADIPLLLGLLVMTVGTFEFYKRFIEPIGEGAGGSLHSLFGMIGMASLPFVLFFEALIPYRYMILSAFGLIVVAKDQQLKRKYRELALGRYYARWERQATLQALAAFDVGVIYYYLLEPHRYQSLVELLGHLPSSLPQSWRTAINLVCGSGVLFVSTILFFVNGKDLLHKGDFQPELLVRHEPDSPDAPQDGLLLFADTYRLIARIYSYCYLVRVFSSLNGALLSYLIIKVSGGAPGHSAVLASAATFCAIAAGFSLNSPWCK